MPKKDESVLKCQFWSSTVQGRSSRAFAQLAPVFIHCDRNVGVLRHWQSEVLLQAYLAWRIVEKISSPDHVRDALYGIVHHHGELIGKGAVRTTDDKVTHGRRHVLRIDALDSILETNHSGNRHPEPP